MAFTLEQMVNILFKRVFGRKSYTNPNLSTDEEPFSGDIPVKFSDVWVDDIPVNNPLSNHITYGNNSVYPTSGQQIIKKYHKLQLKPVTASVSNKSFYYTDTFGDIIPSEYGDGKYQWELWRKDSNGSYNIKIPYNLNNWFLDPVNGVVTFLGEFPQGINNTTNPPAITVYQYTGRKGSASLLSTSTSNYDDNTIGVDDSGKLTIKSKYKVSSYTSDKLNSNANLISNTFTITHNLSTKYIDVVVHEKQIDGAYQLVMVPYKVLNNSQVQLSFSPNVKSSDYSINITGK